MGYLFTFILQFVQFAMVATGMQMVFSVAGVYFHAAPTIYIVAAYSYGITQLEGWSVLASAGFSMALVLCVAFGFAFLQRRFSTDTFEVISITSTLGFLSIANSWNSLTNGPLGLSGIPRPEGFSSLGMMLLLNVIILCVVLAVAALLLNSKFGRALRAAKEHPQALETLGLSKTKLRTGAIVFASMVLAVAAWSFVWEFRFVIPSSFGISLLIEAASVAILASKPQLSYALGAALLVSLTPELLRFIDLPAESFGYLRAMIYSSIIIVTILLFRKKLTLTNRTV